MNKTHNIKGLISFITIVFLSIFMPLATGLILLMISPFTKSKYTLVIGVALIVYVFFLMNINKEIVNDLVWYSQHFF